MMSCQSAPVLQPLSHSRASRPLTSRSRAALQHKERLAASRTAAADVNAVNIYVKSPFKQIQTYRPQLQTNNYTRQPQHQSVGVTPDRELIQQTAEAAYNVAQFALVSNAPSGSHSRKQGRLLKARLVPMNPVKIEGPQISQCRGIVAGTRPQSTSRTLARQKLIITMLTADKGQTG